MDQARQRLFWSHFEEIWLWVIHHLRFVLRASVAILFFALAMAIFILAMFYSDTLTGAVNTCIQVKDKFAIDACLASLNSLWQKVQKGEPAGFYNL